MAEQNWVLLIPLIFTGLLSLFNAYTAYRLKLLGIEQLKASGASEEVLAKFT